MKNLIYIQIILFLFLVSCRNGSTGGSTLSGGNGAGSGALTQPGTDNSNSGLGHNEGNGVGHNGGNGVGFEGRQTLTLKDAHVRCALVSTEKSKSKEKQILADISCIFADQKGNTVTKKPENENIRWLPPEIPELKIEETACLVSANTLNYKCSLKLEVDASTEEEKISKLQTAEIKVSAEVKNTTSEETVVKSSSVIIEVNYDTGGFPMLNPLVLNSSDFGTGTLEVPVSCESNGVAGTLSLEMNALADPCEIKENRLLVCATEHGTRYSTSYYDEYGDYIDHSGVISLACTTDEGKLTRIQKVPFKRVVTYPLIFTATPMVLTEGDSSGWNYTCTGEGGCQCELSGFGTGSYIFYITQVLPSKYEVDKNGIQTKTLPPGDYGADFTCHDSKGRETKGTVPLHIEKGEIDRFLSLQVTTTPAGGRYEAVPAEIVVPYDTGIRYPYSFSCTSSYSDSAVLYYKSGCAYSTAGIVCNPFTPAYSSFNEEVSCSADSRTLTKTIRITPETVPAPQINMPNEIIVPFDQIGSPITVPVECTSQGRQEMYDANRQNSTQAIVGLTSSVPWTIPCDAQPGIVSNVRSFNCTSSYDKLQIELTCRDTYPLTGAYAESSKTVIIKHGEDQQDSDGNGVLDINDTQDKNYPLYNDLRHWETWAGEYYFSDFNGRNANLRFGEGYVGGYFRGTNQFITGPGERITFSDLDGDGVFDYIQFSSGHSGTPK